MSLKMIALVGVVAASFAANAFAGSCCPKKSVAAVAPAATVAKAEKKDASCSVSSSAKDSSTTGTCEKK